MRAATTLLLAASSLIAGGCGGRSDPRLAMPVDGDNAGDPADPDPDDGPQPPAPPVEGGFGAGTLPSCPADGSPPIDADELPFVAGAVARYRLNPLGTTVPVDVQGAEHADADRQQLGHRLWDFSDPDGELRELHLRPAEGHWTAEEFPDADLIAPLDPRTTVLGVYHLAESGAVELLGAAGETPEEGTLLPYAPPVPLLKFPLKVGESWSTDTTVTNARLSGMPFAARDRYDVAVDAQGEVRLGILTFPHAVRLHIQLTRTFPIGAPVSRHQHLWLTECWGEVARATSGWNESEAEFTDAEEFRRLGL